MPIAIFTITITIFKIMRNIVRLLNQGIVNKRNKGFWCGATENGVEACWLMTLGSAFGNFNVKFLKQGFGQEKSS